MNARRSASFFLFALLSIGVASAHADTINLGAATTYTVLASQDLTLNTFVVNGNVGAQAADTLQKGTITGNLSCGGPFGTTAGTCDNSNFLTDFHVTGTATQNVNLSGAIAAYTSVSTSYGAIAGSSLTVNATAGSPLTLTGSGGTNVYNITDFTANGATITLNGSANDVFVFNISGLLTYAQSTMVLTGGVQANNILFNLIGGCGTSLGTDTVYKSNSLMFGIIDGPCRNIVLTDVGVKDPGDGLYGEVYGQDITIHSGATIIGSVPEPSALLLFGSGGLMLLAGLRHPFSIVEEGSVSIL